jgi:hypothetical protein
VSREGGGEVGHRSSSSPARSSSSKIHHLSIDSRHHRRLDRADARYGDLTAKHDEDVPMALDLPTGRAGRRCDLRWRRLDRLRGGRGGHLATPTPMAGRIRPRESDPRSPTSGAPVAGSHLLFARHAMELREARAEGAWPQFPMPRRPPSPGHTSAKPAAAAQGFTDPAARGPDPAEERRIPPPVNTSNPSPPTIFQREKGDAGRQQSPAAAVLAFCRFAGFWLRRRPGVWAVVRARGLRCASLPHKI